jgi:hypothetical protein
MEASTPRDYDKERAELLQLAASLVPTEVTAAIELSRAQLAAAEQLVKVPEVVISHEGTRADP